VPGRDFIRFLPFDGQFSDPDWTDQPDVIRRALTNFSAADTGSGTEATTLTAVAELEKQEGLRALLLLTDGATSSEAQRSKMWAALDRAGVDVMAAHIGGWDDPARERRLLQDVAAVGGGFFADVESQGQIDALAERAVDWMRRPARYGLTVETSTLPPPEPAKLSVAGPVVASDAGSADTTDTTGTTDQPPQVTAASPAVELIIDASGSMLQQLGTEGRRIDVAHRVLDDLIRQKLPAETPVALRAFGDDAPGSCATTLRSPLAPLSPDDLAPIATGIEPVNLAKTPIAASLAATSDDLATATIPHVVVLVTDGEETCGGDPEVEIAKLRASGVEVTVNIVGFAVDDSAIAATLAKWAAEGGGRYLPASDEKGLGAALTDAVLEGFTVEDASGKIIAQGQVGGAAVALPSGTYKVVVGGGRVAFPTVSLTEGEARVLDLPKD
jgi:Mg-chelatase subunit ChlD